jgi:hypothetical protein
MFEKLYSAMTFNLSTIRSLARITTQHLLPNPIDSHHIPVAEPLTSNETPTQPSLYTIYHRHLVRFDVHLHSKEIKIQAKPVN